MFTRFEAIPIRGLWIEATSESVRDAEIEDTALLKLIDIAHIACLLSTQDAGSLPRCAQLIILLESMDNEQGRS